MAAAVLFAPVGASFTAGRLRFLIVPIPTAFFVPPLVYATVKLKVSSIGSEIVSLVIEART